MPPLGTKNLGLIKAIHVGVNPPLNTKILWYNDATTPYTTGPAKVHYYYDVILADWYPLNGVDATGTFTYIAFASNCEGTEDFSFELNPVVHCYWAIISSDNIILGPALTPSLFENRWTQFCACAMPGEPQGEPIYTYIGFADDCEGTNFGLDPMYEVACEDCQWADSYNVASGSNAFGITPNGDGIQVDITNAAAGSEVFIDLTLNTLPLTDLLEYCVQITAPIQFTGEVEIHIGDEPNKLLLNTPATEWKNELLNNGSQLVLKIPDDFVGVVNTTFTIQIGTKECCSIQEGDKCYCCREYWGVYTSSTPLAEVTAELFTNRWIKIGGCDNDCSSDCEGLFNIHTQQIEALNQQLIDYMQVTNTRIKDLENVIGSMQQTMSECCDNLQGQINALTTALNDYINQNNENTGVIIGEVEQVKGRVQTLERTVTEEGLAPLVQPTIGTSIAVYNAVVTRELQSGIAYTDAEIVKAKTYTDESVQPLDATQVVHRAELDDHEARITTLEP